MTSHLRHPSPTLPELPPVVRRPRAPSIAAVVALLAAAACGCASTRARPPSSYEKLSIVAFADALYERAPHFDSDLGISLWWFDLDRSFLDFFDWSLDYNARRQRAGRLLREEFWRWCQENGGEELASPEVKAQFASAAREYIVQRGERDAYSGSKVSVDTAMCAAKDQSLLAGYANFAGLEIAFHDAASARTFMDTFVPRAQAREQARAAGLRAEAEALVRADPHPEHEAWRAEVVAGINRVMRGEQGFGGVLEYLGHCRVQVSVGQANGPSSVATLSLRSLDHARLTNVSWMDMDAAASVGIGVLYFVEVIDKRDPREGHLSLRTEDAARQVVRGLEELGHSCGAW